MGRFTAASRLVCFFATGALVYGFQAPAQAPATGSMEGQVVNAKTGAPLKRVTVRVVGLPGNNGPMPAPVAPALSTAGIAPRNRGPVTVNKETDEQGRFVVAGLEPGKYRVSAERQGFLRQGYGAKKFSGGNTPVVVAEGQTVKAIDFRLMPQGVIAGRVLDEDGEPVANVQVRAQRSYMRNGKRQWNTVANANTSDIGEYRLPELSPGRYVVAATVRGNPMNFTNTPNTEPLPNTPELTYTQTYYPSTADSAAAIPVDVGEGTEVRSIDVRLVKGRVFRVRGRLTGIPQNGGRSVVPIMLTPREGGQGQQPMAQARGADGTFEIRNVPAGQYLAHAQTNVGGVQYVAVAAVDVIGSHVDGVTLALASGGDVPGTVKVVDASDAVELKNLQVNLRSVGFGSAAPRGKVGEDLKFTLKNVPPERYAVSVAGIPENCYLQSVKYGGAEVTEEGVQMTGGQMEVTISAAAGQIDLIVMTKDDKVAGSAQVLVLRDGTPWQSRSTDENGMVSLKGLRPGSYKVLAWEDVDGQQLWDTDYLRKFDNDFKSVKVDARGHEAVQLKAIPPDAN